MSLRTKSMLSMMLCAALWSIAGIFIKLIPWNALVIAGFRSLIAAAVVFGYIKLRRLPLVFNKRTVLIAVMLTGTFCSFVGANKLTTAANAIALQYCAPVFILIYNAAVLKQRLRAADVAVVTLTLLGIALFFFDNLGFGSTLGNLVAILAGVFFAAMFLTTSSVDEPTRMSGLLWGQLLTALVGIPLSFVFDTPVTTAAIVSLLVLGILQLGLPYVLFTIAMRGCPPLVCSLLSVLEPLLNPVWVLLFVGETPSVFALIGGVIVVASITLWCVYDQRQAARAAAAAA